MAYFFRKLQDKKFGELIMNNSEQLLKQSPQEFIQFLKEENIYRFYFIYDKTEKIVKSSSPELQPLADFISSDKRDFLFHEGLFFQLSRDFDTLFGAFIHRTNRGQAAGGVRYWNYKTMEDYLRDGLRLAKGMTRKNALAGLWWGGGKGVIAFNPELNKDDLNIRGPLYAAYGSFISSLQGCYVTAEDVGTSVTDMSQVFSNTRFTTCIPSEIGGSGNPSVPTARGVISGMEAGLHYIGESSLEGKTVAVQGMGHVGEPLIKFLFEKGVMKVIACDINPANVHNMKEKYYDQPLEAKVSKANDDSFFSVECDIFSPNATGAILNPHTISLLKAKIVCGAANNQLEDTQRDDADLLNRHIVYIPDFLTNRMGIVNCADEQYGYVNNDSHFERHLEKNWEHSIYQTALKVLNEKEQGIPPARAAVSIADELSIINHPIFGHRGQQIIDSLVANEWHRML